MGFLPLKSYRDSTNDVMIEILNSIFSMIVVKTLIIHTSSIVCDAFCLFTHNYGDVAQQKLHHLIVSSYLGGQDWLTQNA